MAGSLLLNSSSLKDLLMGVSDVRKRKAAAAKSEQMVGSILEQDAYESEKAKKRMRARALRKKINKKRSLLDRTGAASGLQRARQIQLTFNTVYEYGRVAGLERDSVDFLERQFAQSEVAIRECISKLKIGVEQLCGPDVTVLSPADADLVLALCGVDLEGQSFSVDGVQFPLSSDGDDHDFKPISAPGNAQSEGMAMELDDVAQEGKVYRHAAPADDTPSAPTQTISYAHFVRAFENLLRKNLLVLYLGEVKGFAPRNTRERFLHRDGWNNAAEATLDGGLGSTLFGESTELEAGGQMDGSMYDTQPDSRAATLRNGGGGATQSTMFVSSVNLTRPMSGGNDFPGHSTHSNLPRIPVENSSNVFSQSEKDILPPLRLGRNMRKQRKELGLTLGRKHFTKAGFDASFTRSTPRVLQNKPAAPRDLSEGGGATQAEIDALRWELTVAREGIKHLDKMVDTNIAWVQTNCDMSVMAGNFSNRTRQKCQNMATERITNVLGGWLDNTLFWAMRRWQTAVRYDRLTLAVQKFSKLKGIERLTIVLWKVITNQMLLRGWQPWLRFVQAQILRKMNAAALHIQRIVRGKLGRVKFNKIKLGQVAITLQKLFRKTKAVAVIKEKRFVREQEMNNAAIRAIQKLLSNLIKIRLAKAEVKKLREHRATVRIQKVHRGRAGRKKFLYEYMLKKQAEDRAKENADLDGLAAAHGDGHAPYSATAGGKQHGHDGHHGDAAVHNTHKRSLFHAEDGSPGQSGAAASPRVRLKSAPAKKGGEASPPVHSNTARRSLDHSPEHRRPVTPSAPTLSTLTAATEAAAPAPDHAHGKVHAGNKSPPHSAMRVAHGGKAHPQKSTHGASDNASQSTAGSSTVKTSKRKAGGRTPAASSQNTPAPSRPTSRPSSRSPSRPNSAMPAGSPAKPSAAHPTRGSAEVLEPEALTADSLDDDVISSVNMLDMLKRQDSAKKIQGLLRSKVTNKKGAAEPKSSAKAQTSASKRKQAEDASHAKASGGKSSRPAANAKKPPAEKGGEAAVAVPDEVAVTNIQKIARGKLARARSKKLLEDKESDPVQPAPVVEAATSAKVPTPVPITAPEPVARPLSRPVSQPVAKQEEETAERADAADGTQEIEAAPTPQKPSTPMTLSILPPDDEPVVYAQRPKSSSRPGSRKAPHTPEAPVSKPPTPAKLASKPSSPMLTNLSSSILSSFHIPSLFGSRPSSQSQLARTVSPPEERPTSSTSFFRNPFSGWGSRGNSRESTPVKQRPGSSTTQGAAGGGVDMSFTRSQRIEEQVEAEGADEQDMIRLQQEKSAKLIQSRARGMRDRHRVEMIKEERAAALEHKHEHDHTPVAEDEVQELANIFAPENDVKYPSDKPNTAPVSPTKPLPTKAGASGRGGAFGAGSVSAKPAVVRRGSMSKQENKDQEKSGTRRTSFDKSQETSLPRRGSFGEKDAGRVSPTPQLRAPSADHEERSGVRRAPSTDEKSSTTARRASFDKEKGPARSAVHEREKDKAGSKTVHVGAGASAGSRGKPGQEPHRRSSAPAQAMDAPAAVATAAVDAAPLAPAESTDAHEHEAEHELEHEDDVPSQMLPDFTPVDISELHDFTGASGVENSALGVSGISEGADYSVNDLSGVDNNSTVRSALHDKSSGSSKSAKDRAKREKDEAAKTAKDKANNKKKEAEDKRKADAAKAKASRDEKDVSKHTSRGNPKDKETSVSKHAKPAAPSAPPPKKDAVANKSGADGDHSGSASKGGDTSDPISRQNTPKMPSGSQLPTGSRPASRSGEAKSSTGKTPRQPTMEPEQAIAKIQNRARIGLAKAKVESKKEDFAAAQKKLGMLVHWAVVTIQRNFRGRWGRRRFQQHMLLKQVELAQKREEGIRKIQARSRGMLGRKKASFVKELRRKERQELEWMASYQKTDGKKIGLRVENASPPKQAPAEKKPGSSSKKRALRESTEPDASSTPVLDVVSMKQTEEMMERFQKLDQMERQLRERAEKMEEFERASKAREEAMEKALRLIEEQTKKAEADRLAQQQLLMMAAGPMSHRSDYASPFSTQQRRMMGTGPRNGTMPLASARRSVPNSARVPDAPPTARSARGGAGIPPDAARMTYNGEDWVQLWDPDEAAYYWYCERTQFAQWDAPGAANNASSATMVANYHNANDGDDSGYESAGAMTDYSTDHNDEYSAYTDETGYDDTVWHEYWDESAQAKYWYNEITGEASWTKPESLLTNGSEDGGSTHLAITNGMEDQSAPGSGNEWVSYIDEDTEQAYWYNVRTGETSWA